MSQLKTEKLEFPFSLRIGNVSTNFKTWKSVQNWVDTSEVQWEELSRLLGRTEVVRKMRQRINEGHILLRNIVAHQVTNEIGLQEQHQNFRLVMDCYSNGRYPALPGGDLWIDLQTLATSKEAAKENRADISATIASWQKMSDAITPPKVSFTSDHPLDNKPNLTAVDSTAVEKTVGEIIKTERKNAQTQAAIQSSGLLAENFMDNIARNKQAIDMLQEKLETLSAESADLYGTLTQAISQAKSANADLQQVEDQTEKLASMGTYYKELVNRIEGAADKAANQAAETVTAKRILDKPAEYWNLKSVAHGTLKGKAFKLFWILCAIAGIAIPAVTILVFFVMFPDAKLSEWATFFALIGAPALLAVWIIRLKSKEYLSHEVLKADADERVTMMNVYLSLIAQGNIPDEDRHLMLRALFRPANTALTDDPMPGWLGAVVDQLPKPAKPGG